MKGINIFIIIFHSPLYYIAAQAICISFQVMPEQPACLYFKCLCTVTRYMNNFHFNSLPAVLKLNRGPGKIKLTFVTTI